MAKNLILWVVIALVLMSVFNNFGQRRASSHQIDYSQFIADVKAGRVKKVVTYFTKGLPRGAKLRKALHHSRSMGEAKHIVMVYFESLAHQGLHDAFQRAYPA